MVSNILSLTQNATNQIKYLLGLRISKTCGMRITISTKGCNGILYDMDYVTEPLPDEIEIKHDEVSLFIKKSHVMWLAGTIIDYEDDLIKPGFRFLNEKIKGRCNCGESYIF